ncbi:MAG: RNase adapter RapZ [Francisellaceae bacterium]|jgi:RNase adapter protein RapZ|nr:RNase adapter RapZ [Francisellaceae bacterium]
MRKQLLIISGVSGSGKSVALNALEDAGFYCIDNLPMSLLEFLDKEIDPQKQKVAISLDSRNTPGSTEAIKDLLLSQKKHFSLCSLIYLNCDDNILLNRYTETRRRHPLSSQGLSLGDAIAEERELMAPIADLADISINSSTLSSHELHDLINKQINNTENNKAMIIIKSFGFKHGVPSEADFVFDVRCLPNPYWQKDLRSHSGLDQKVKDFLSAQDSVTDLITDIHTFLKKWLDVFSKSNRSYISVAIGCTGGQHRSVYVSEILYNMIKKQFDHVLIKHREIKSISNKKQENSYTL